MDVVLRKEGKYLDLNGNFYGLTVEEAMVFPSEEAALLYISDQSEIEMEWHAQAVAREDQEYALQLEDLRG